MKYQIDFTVSLIRVDGIGAIEGASVDGTFEFNDEYNKTSLEILNADQNEIKAVIHKSVKNNPKIKGTIATIDITNIRET